MAKQKLIDPIYKKYAARVIGALASTEFYEYFMDVLNAGQTSIQFSNRRVEKYVDERWVIAIEACIKPMEEIINNPRNFIMQEEVIVNVALAKKVTPDSIRHLSQHGDMIDKYEEGNVRPNRLMEKYKEDSWNTYENKFVYTLLEMTWEFVDKRYEAIFAAMGDEFGAHLKLNSDSRSYTEHVRANVELRIQQEEDLLSADKKNETIFSRIARLHRILSNFKSSSFAKAMEKFGKIKPPLVPTNAIKKNPNFKACHKLWNFILAYTDVGYKIDIFEQSTEISDDFLLDINHTIMIDYIVLKHYLEDRKDREIDTTRTFKKKAIKPKYIHEIIEEIVKNYDLPDVEVRKVLIEEITKAQLLKEEEAERMRLVEEKEKEMQEKRRLEEIEAKKKAREEEREKRRLEKERQKEIARQEKLQAQEIARQKKEAERIAAEEKARIERFLEELNSLDKAKEERERQRAKDEESRRRAAEKQKEDEQRAAEKKAEAEKKKAEKEKARQKLAEEKAREKEKLEKEKAKEKAKEKEKIEKEKAREKARKEKAKEKEKARKEAKKKLASKPVIETVPESMPGLVQELTQEPVPEMVQKSVDEPIQELVQEPVEAVIEIAEKETPEEIKEPEERPASESEAKSEPVSEPVPEPEPIETGGFKAFLKKILNQ